MALAIAFLAYKRALHLILPFPFTGGVSAPPSNFNPIKPINPINKTFFYTKPQIKSKIPVGKHCGNTDKRPETLITRRLDFLLFIPIFFTNLGRPFFFQIFLQASAHWSLGSLFLDSLNSFFSLFIWIFSILQ